MSWLATWILALPSLFGAEPADLVLTGGKIVSLDRQPRVVEALAVRDGKLIAVGSDAVVHPFIGAKSEVIRLNGKMALPGFIESHCHAVGVARGVLDQTYVELTNIAEMQNWIRQQALSRIDALRTVTQWPAYLNFDESKLGTLEVGKLADLVGLDRDYLTCPETDIARLSVERTIVAGKTVFRKSTSR